MDVLFKSYFKEKVKKKVRKQVRILFNRRLTRLAYWSLKRFRINKITKKILFF
jgi:hypothetical protein